MRGRIYGSVAEHGFDLTRENVDFTQSVDFIAEKFNTDSRIRRVGGKNLHNVAANTEGITDKVYIVSFILDAD